MRFWFARRKYTEKRKMIVINLRPKLNHPRVKKHGRTNIQVCLVLYLEYFRMFHYAVFVFFRFLFFFPALLVCSSQIHEELWVCVVWVVVVGGRKSVVTKIVCICVAFYLSCPELFPQDTSFSFCWKFLLSRAIVTRSLRAWRRHAENQNPPVSDGRPFVRRRVSVRSAFTFE